MRQNKYKYLASIVPLVVFFFIGLTNAQADSTITTNDTDGGGQGAIGYDGSNQFAGQSFLAGVTGQINSIGYLVCKVLVPADNLQAVIMADSSGNPSGTALGTSNSVAASSLNTYAGTCGGSRKTFTFSSPVNVTSGNTYWVILQRTSSNSTVNYFITTANNTNAYSDGTAKTCNSDYSSCFQDNSSPTWDDNLQVTIVTGGGGGGDGSTTTPIGLTFFTSTSDGTTTNYAISTTTLEFINNIQTGQIFLLSLILCGIIILITFRIFH